MANNLIQIKRSLNTANPTSLANGELAFTANGDVLFIGSNSAVVAIGGKRNPGVLTANQALVANSSSAIDKVIVANLAPTNVWANGAAGSGGQVLTSNATGGVYWSSPSAGVAGSNSQVQFNANGVLAGDADFTFDGVSNILTLTGTINTTTVNATTVNAATHSVGTATVANATGVWTTGTVNAASHTVGSTFTANATLVNAAAINIVGQTNTATFFATTSANVGANVQANTTAYFVGNSTVNSYQTSAVVLVSNSTATSNLTATGLNVGANVVVNTSTVFLGNSTVNNTITATSYYVGNSTANVSIAPNSIRVSNSTITTFGANTTRIVIGNSTPVEANGGVGTLGQVLTSNATGVFWSSVGTITSVNPGNGMGGGGNSGSVTLNVVAADGLAVNSTAVYLLANSGITANSSGTFVKAGTGVTVNATGVHIGQSVGTTDNVTFANVVTTDLTVNGNTTLGDATSDKVTINARVGSALVPTANITYDLGTSALRWNNVYSNAIISGTGTFTGNLNVGGDIVITGNLITQNVSSVVISDPLIYLAGNNYTSDVVDIGFVANYNNGVNRHTGLFRDATDGVYKLFNNLTQELDNQLTVNVADPTFAIATLNAYLLSGGLVSNATNINITANSTLAVAIVANTLSLSTALPATSGGTGTGTYTSGDILVANTGNSLSKLSLGTSGYVLQSNGTALVYDTLDGGTF